MRKPRLFLLLSRAHHAVKTRMERETKSTIGLTRLELAALWALDSKPGLGVQALAKELHVDHAVVSRLKKQLFRKGVARHVSDPSDRRRAPIELTEAGKDKAQAGLRILRQANTQITEGFSEQEIAVVGRFFEHLIEVSGTNDPRAIRGKTTSKESETS